MGEAMHGRVATYTVTGDVHDIARRAEEGMLPIFRAQPGFKAYTLFATGDTLISYSARCMPAHLWMPPPNPISAKRC